MEIPMEIPYSPATSDFSRDPGTRWLNHAKSQFLSGPQSELKYV